MRYAKQKFLIFICFIGMIPTFMLALLETPELSTWVMNVSLSFVRMRTGLKIDAKSWEVNPLTMSAKIENVEVRHDKLTFEAPRIQIWISPLSLIVGKLHLNDFEVVSARFEVKDDEAFSKSFFIDDAKDKSNDKSFIKSGNLRINIPLLLGHFSEKYYNKIKSRNIEFDELRIKNLSLHWGHLRADNLSLSLNNLQEGQSRLEWDFRGIEIQGGIKKFSQFGGTISLLAKSKSKFQIFIGDVYAKLDEEETTNVMLRGDWPGEVSFESKVNLESVNKWLIDSPWLVNQKLLEPSHGNADISGNIILKEKKIVNSDLKITTKNLNYEGYNLNKINLNIKLSYKNSKDLKYKIEKFSILLPHGLGTKSNWSNQIQLSDISYEEDRIKLKVILEEAGICGILRAAAEKECQVGIAASGVVDLEGNLNPLNLNAIMDLNLSKGPVMSDAYGILGSEPVVNIKPSRMILNAQVLEKNLKINSLKLNWNNQNELEADGEIIYVPTKIDLKAKAKDFKLEEVLDDIVGLKFGGPFEINARIKYDHSLVRKKRVDIKTDLKSANISFEDQMLGSILGPLEYENRVLKLGPFQLRSGGGTSIVNGKLTPDPEKGAYFNLSADTKRFEIVSYLDREKTTEAFRGFVSGRATLGGYVDRLKSDSPGLLGTINLNARNFIAFKIPFNEASLSADYVNDDLKISELVARKDGGTIKLNGVLSPKGGSELKFSSDTIPIQNIEIEPKLSLFESGQVKIDGFWKPSLGWGIKGKVKGASIAGTNIGSSNIELNGDERSLNINVKFKNLIDFKYRGLYQGKNLNIDLLEANLNGRGIYAGLAYLGDWVEPKPVLTAGKLSFRWTPKSGFLKTEDLRISAPHLDRIRREDVLNVPGSQEIVWNNSKYERGSLSWDGVSILNTTANVGAESIALNADLPLGLVKLFVPALDMRFGRVSLNVLMPLSPNFTNLVASGKLRDGIIKIPGIATELDNLKLDFEVQRGQVNLKNASMAAGSGIVSLQGIYMLDFEEPAIDLNLILEQAKIVVLDDILTSLDGTLNVRGTKMPYLLSGRLAVSDALYSKEFDTVASDFSKSALENDDSIKLDLDLEILDNGKIKNSIIDSSLKGRISLKGSTQEALINGDIDFPNGIIRANNVEFKIIQGQAQFFGDREGIPTVNMRAQTTMRYAGIDYRIEMNARGPGNSLNIEFSSEPTLSNQDIVSLLAFGVIRQETLSSEGSDDLVLAAQAEAFQAIFGRAIGNSLSNNTGFDIRLKPSAVSGSATEAIPKVSVMRRLSERVTARYARSLDIGNPEKDLQVDYRLLDNVNLSGIWENPKPEETSLGVDLRFRFEVK